MIYPTYPLLHIAAAAGRLPRLPRSAERPEDVLLLLVLQRRITPRAEVPHRLRAGIQRMTDAGYVTAAGDDLAITHAGDDRLAVLESAVGVGVQLTPAEHDILTQAAPILLRLAGGAPH